MAKLPTQKTTLNIIDTLNVDEYTHTMNFLKEVEKILEEKAGTKDKIRGYLGMSGIGDPCERKLWYSFHFASRKESFTPETLRTFDTGHIAEGFVYRDLKAAGCEVFGEQEEYSDIAGHFQGHSDGKVLGLAEAPKTLHLLEIKTHNLKSFDEVKKVGVQRAKPVHYAQMQIYMHYEKLERALYIAYNKNNHKYYFERVYYDKDFALGLVEKAKRIIFSEVPPAPAFPKTYFHCKQFCNHYATCHGNMMPTRNCRTCENGDILDDGKWECSYHNIGLSVKDQKEGCVDHSWGWGLED